MMPNRLQNYTLTELFMKKVQYEKELEIVMEKHSPEFVEIAGLYDDIKKIENRINEFCQPCP